MGHAVKRDGLVEEGSSNRPLHLDHDVIPSVVLRPARHAGWNPFLIDITVDVPFVSASKTALVAPDVALPTGELIDVKLDRLRVGGRAGIEIYVVYEMTSTLRERVVVVRKPPMKTSRSNGCSTRGQSMGGCRQSFLVSVFERPSLMIPQSIPPVALSITQNKLMVTLKESSESVWILDNVDH